MVDASWHLYIATGHCRFKKKSKYVTLKIHGLQKNQKIKFDLFVGKGDLMIPSEEKRAEISVCIENQRFNSGKNSEESYQKGGFL